MNGLPTSKSLCVCVLYKDGTFKSLYEFIPTWEEAELLAQYAMCFRRSIEDLIFIFPGYNIGIDKKPELWKKAQELAKEYERR